MPAKQVSKDSQVVVGEPPVPVSDAQAVQAAVDTVGQDTKPEALFASGETPPTEATPANLLVQKPGAIAFNDGAWWVLGDDMEWSRYDGAMVAFVSNDPGLTIDLGDVQVRFDLGRAQTPEPVADRMKRHFLYTTNKFFAADEVAVIGNDIVSYRDHAAFTANVARMRKGEVVLYATKASPGLVVEFGDFQVRFEDGYAAVEPDKVARFERHMFVREGRVTRLQAV